MSFILSFGGSGMWGDSFVSALFQKCFKLSSKVSKMQRLCGVIRNFYSYHAMGLLCEFKKPISVQLACKLNCLGVHLCFCGARCTCCEDEANKGMSQWEVTVRSHVRKSHYLQRGSYSVIMVWFGALEFFL